MDQEGQIHFSVFVPVSLAAEFVEVAGSQSRSSALREAIKSYIAAKNDEAAPPGGPAPEHVVAEHARDTA